MNEPDLNAKSGDQILPFWERLKAYVLSLRLLAGNNVRIAWTPQGTFVSFDTGSSWPSPFKPTLYGLSVQFQKGLVEGLEPTIQTGGQAIPISGDADKKIDPPSLTLNAKQIDAATQTSWLALECEADKKGNLTVGKDGKLLPGLRLEVVHTAKLAHRSVANPTGESGGQVGMEALALVVWQNGAPMTIQPIVHHNLNYARTFPTDGQGAVKHFFWAV